SLGVPASAEPLWGIQAEQLEYRVGEDENVLAYDLDAFVGSDELKVVWRSEGEFSLEEEAWEALENQLRVQVPVSTFFDAVAGVRVDTPEGPNRVHAVIGLHGLAQQWFEVDADLFLSDHPSLRVEAEYEGLITNRIILVPSVELDVPFTDDAAADTGAWGPKLEVGLRLSYDLVDRAVSPYVGVHYERVFGETASIAEANGEDPGAVFFVAGTRLMF
ncbi:MAG: copper resistance protein B, partial [Pseudomonadota bacterium]